MGLTFSPAVFSMSEDDGHESGCDTVEGSPASDTSTSPRGSGPFGYLDNGRPPVAAPAPPPPPRGVRTMVVPPMRVQNNNTQGREERLQRTGQSTMTSSLLQKSFLYQHLDKRAPGPTGVCSVGGVCSAGLVEAVGAYRPLVGQRGFNR